LWLQLVCSACVFVVSVLLDFLLHVPLFCVFLKYVIYTSVQVVCKTVGLDVQVAYWQRDVTGFTFPYVAVTFITGHCVNIPGQKMK
jgi:hypothetical protein